MSEPVAKPAQPPLRIDPRRVRRLTNWRLWLGAVIGAAIAALTGTYELFLRAELWPVLAAVPAGHILFGFSAGLNRLSLRYGVRAFRESVRHVWRPYALETMGFYAVLVLAEEALFRAVPLELLGKDVIHVAWLAAVFTAVHIAGRRGPKTLLVLDLLIFGWVLGLLYLWLGQIWPLAIIHFVRNASVAKVFVSRSMVRTGA